MITFTAIDVDQHGLVNPREVERALSEATCLISIMHSNNEVGSIQPVREIAQMARDRKILMHSDAAQSIGKVLNLPGSFAFCLLLPSQALLLPQHHAQP